MLVSDLRVMGRATQGVRLITLRDDDEIAAIARVRKEAVEDEEVDLSGAETIEGSADIDINMNGTDEVNPSDDVPPSDN